MCGFPLAHLDKHLKVLIRNHQRYVALSEEFKLEGGGFERRVTRILTPGTLIDEAFLNPYENNYVLSIGCSEESADRETSIGLAWMDVSTGEFFSQRTTLGALRDEVVRIGPKEIVLHEKLRRQDLHPIRVELTEETTIFQSFVDAEVAVPSRLKTAERPNSDDITLAAPILPEYASEEAIAISQLTKFLSENLLEHMPTLSQPLHQGADERMQIDAHTIKSLEIKEAMREGGVTGTLLSVINRTHTTSGSRLLSRWIHSPSTSMSEITTRQTIVTFFKARPHLRSDLIGILRKVEDAARIVQRFLAGRGTPDDLRGIGAAIAHWEAFRTRLAFEREMEVAEQGALVEWECMDGLLSKMASLKDLSEKISGAVSSHEEVEPTKQDEEELLDPLVASTGSKAIVAGSFKWHIKPG
jgi:DNA mismatch repair ATPase MutS